MAIKDVKTFIDRRGLVETTDSEIEKPIYRRLGFDGVRSFGEMEEIFSRMVREKRDGHNLNRAQLAMMLGLSEQVFARYERAISKMHVTRLIHLAELLGFSPIEALHAAAPHLFGDSEQEAEIKLKLIMRMLDLPASTAQHLLMMIEELSPDSSSDVSPRRGRTGRED